MIDPKDVEINGRNFVLSKFTAMKGLKIVTQWSTNAVPKMGNFDDHEKIAIELMGFVGVRLDNDNIIKLTTRDLIDNHTGDWETYGKVQVAMMEYNCSFFQNGRISSFFTDIAQKLPQLISKILMDCLQQLSPTTKPPSTN